MEWRCFGLGALVGGIVGTAIGMTVWAPVGGAAVFACGILTGVGAGMFCRQMADE